MPCDYVLSSSDSCHLSFGLWHRCPESPGFCKVLFRPSKVSTLEEARPTSVEPPVRCPLMSCARHCSAPTSLAADSPYFGLAPARTPGKAGVLHRQPPCSSSGLRIPRVPGKAPATLPPLNWRNGSRLYVNLLRMHHAAPLHACWSGQSLLRSPPHRRVLQHLAEGVCGSARVIAAQELKSAGVGLEVSVRAGREGCP